MYSPGQADAHEAFMFIIERYRGEMSGGLELVEVTEKTWICSVPSGKLTYCNYGKSPFLMVKSTINGHFQ